MNGWMMDGLLQVVFSLLIHNDMHYDHMRKSAAFKVFAAIWVDI